MDTTTLWPIFIFAIKLPFVGAMALMMALTLWTLDHALRHGAAFETKPGPIRTRAQTPLRYWFYIVSQLLFLVCTAVMIHVTIQLGEPREQPATNTRKEQSPIPAPVRPSDESYDRAEADVSGPPSRRDRQSSNAASQVRP